MKENINVWRERLLYFALGALSLTVIALLLGAASDYQKNSTLNYGRYQLSAWGTQIDKKSGVVGAFVMDTVSGETRTAYIRTYGDVPESRVVRHHLKKPFHAIE